MKKLLVIVGPTGVGKTNLALELAKKFDGEIVSADSRQIYKEMDIGTGKLDVGSKMLDVRKEKGRWIVEAVPIHLYDVITPDKTFSVAKYQQLAYRSIGQIHSKNKLPILVGGTGLYIRAVTEGLKIPKVPPNLKLREKLEAKPLRVLVSELEKVDQQTFEQIDKQNRRRIIRALEIFYETGEGLSRLKNKFKVDFDLVKIGLTSNREFLYDRVDKQVEEWFKTGFVGEVKKLLGKGYKEDLPSMTALGFRQVIMYLAGNITLQEAKQRIKWDQHSYIRRQLTWFRRDRNIYWFDIKEKNFESGVEKQVSKWLKSKKNKFVAGQA